MANLDAILQDWEPVIGLEVHVQLGTASKAFSASATTFGEPPNSLTDPVVLALPGTLPVYNAEATKLALMLGVATQSKIRSRSRFARKHYFYPDLPKGYQISQSDEPLCEEGVLEVISEGTCIAVPLQRIHVEEDAGKSSHHGLVSHVDLNRAGIPLAEVVTAPAIASAAAAAEFMRALHRLVRWLGISDGDMEKGQMRCDANVSVRRRGEDRLGVRTELKNINSFRFVEAAIEHEIARQVRLLENGQRIVRETRLWDADTSTSAPMRSKEEANDYRYFPDPDLPPLAITSELMGEVLRSMPELPAARFRRYLSVGIAADDARTLVNDRALADYFDAAVAALPATGDGKSDTNDGRHPAGAAPSGLPRACANWVLTTLLGALHRDGKSIATSPLPPAAIAEVVMLIESGVISGKIGKDVFDEAYASGGSPNAIVELKGLRQISNPEELQPLIAQIVAANGKQAQAFRAGNEKMLGYFVGQIMKATGGKANPQLVNELLRAALAAS